MAGREDSLPLGRGCRGVQRGARSAGGVMELFPPELWGGDLSYVDGSGGDRQAHAHTWWREDRRTGGQEDRRIA